VSVGHDTEVLGTEWRAKPPKTRDDFIEDEQDAVAIADLTQPLEIPDGRHQHTG
jgi:hypothetical protein